MVGEWGGEKWIVCFETSWRYDNGMRGDRSDMTYHVSYYTDCVAGCEAGETD